MKRHQPSPTLAMLLHEFHPAQPFVTARCQTALDHLHGAVMEGRPLAVLNSGWKKGSDELIQRFLTEVDAEVSLLRVPESCSSEIEGMRELVRSIGVDPKDILATDLQKRFADFLNDQKKNKQRTIVILEDSGSKQEWVHDCTRRLIECQAKDKSGLTVILMRQTKIGRISDEVALDSYFHRTARHVYLTPFTQDETRRFIRWRIDAADSADIGPIFDFQAITLIHELCDGVPDAINQLCCAALELADNENIAPVTTEIVMRVSKRLQLRPTGQLPGASSDLATLQSADIPTLKLPECPRIVLTYNGATLHEVPLNQQRISIGRASENDLCIDSPFISRQHATIYRNGAETAIVDLDSKNGTYVNSCRVQVQTISDQDVIFIGYHQIRFLDPNVPHKMSLDGIRRNGSALPPNVSRVTREKRIEKAGAARR